MSEWRQNIEWTRRYEKFSCQISQHSFRKAESRWDQPHTWCTYILFGDSVRYSKPSENGELELCPPYAVPSEIVDRFWRNERLFDPLPWNGGVTYFRCTTEQNGARLIKVGDDYAHLWDVEGQRFELYDLAYMQRRCDRLAECFALLIDGKPIPGENE